MRHVYLYAILFVPLASVFVQFCSHSLNLDYIRFFLVIGEVELSAIT